VSFSGLAVIEFDEQSIGGRHEVLVLRQLMRRQAYPAGELGQHFGSFLLWKRVELLDESSYALRHATSVPRC